jgi:WD40 repeat protein
VATDFSEVLGIAFSPDGRLMASGGFANDKDNCFARLWDVESGKELRRFMHGRSYGIEALAFSPDGKTLATGAHDARLRLFDVDSGNEVRTFPKNGKSRMHGGCVAFAPDGKTVAAAGESLRLYDVASGDESWHVERRALGLAFTDAGRTLTGAVMGSICRWDAATGKQLTPDGGDSPVEQIAVSAHGTRVVTRGTDGDAHVWDAADGRHLRYVKVAWQHGLAMSPDGRFLVWPVDDESIKFPDPASPGMIYSGARLRLYDVGADKLIDRFPAFKGDAHELTFTDGGRTLVTVDHRDGGVRVWNVEAGKEERFFQALREEEKKLPNSVWRSELSPDGKTLAVAYVLRRPGRGSFPEETYPVRVWDVATGRELHEFDRSAARYVRNLAFSPGGKWLASSGSAFDQIGAGAKLTVWDARTGKTAATVPGGACAVAFSADGRHLATATTDGVIRLWDTATWTKRGEFNGRQDRPTSLAFSPAQPVLFSGSLDTTVLGWDLRGK